jgi:hypothetical protein
MSDIIDATAKIVNYKERKKVNFMSIYDIYYKMVLNNTLSNIEFEEYFIEGCYQGFVLANEESFNFDETLKLLEDVCSYVYNRWSNVKSIKDMLQIAWDKYAYCPDHGFMMKIAKANFEKN